MFKIILPKFFFKVERWKWNPDYRIYVSNMGHFKNEHKQDLPIRISAKKGYVGVIVPNYGFKHAHRLVMLTWKPIPDAENLTIDHLDHNKRNNAVNNLEWVTLEENQTRAKEDLYAECGVPAKGSQSQVMESKPAAVYKAGQLLFATLDEAATWCVKYANGGMTLEQAKNKIEIKCISGAKYCGRKWKRII